MKNETLPPKSLQEKLLFLIEEKIKKRSTYGRERGDLMKEILLGIIQGLMLPAALLVPNLPVALNPLVKKLSNQYKTDKRKLIKSIQALKKSELIKASGKKIKLTKKGESKLFEEGLDLMEISPQKPWDGKWRLIIFDIPNSHSNARDALRGILKYLGLYQLQRSVYIYPYPFKDALDVISLIYNVYEYVIYLEVNHAEGEKFLLQYFKL